ncbi:MAG: response regulator [Patescibacteria group bacterium]
MDIDMSQANPSKKKVLVIEDDRSLQAAIVDKLSMNGLDSILASSKQEGIDALIDNENIALIWLDHYLFGKEDGLDFLNEVRKSKDWQEIPIFVISNTAGTDKVNAYLALGADKYYTKAEHRLDQIIKDIANYIKE